MYFSSSSLSQVDQNCPKQIVFFFFKEDRWQNIQTGD